MALSLAAIPVGARAQLYGLSSSRPSTLFTLDTGTGAATTVTDLTGNRQTGLVGLAFLNSTLYACDVVMPDFTTTFGIIDPVTGAYTPINNQGGSNNWWSLTANHAGGFFYVVDRADGNLKTVTPSGVITTIAPVTGIGPFGVLMTGLAYDENHGILYGIDMGSSVDFLYKIDTTTGATTLIGDLGRLSFMNDLAYDPTADVLYFNDGDFGNLYTIDVLTAALTFVGSNGADVPIDGISFKDAAVSPPTAAPEPGTLALLAAGAAIATGVTRRGGRRRTPA